MYDHQHNFTPKKKKEIAVSENQYYIAFIPSLEWPIIKASSTQECKVIQVDIKHKTLIIFKAEQVNIKSYSKVLSYGF